MEIKNYTDIKGKVENKDFFSTYLKFKGVLWYFSWGANIILVFLGYFLFYKFIHSMVSPYIQMENVVNIISNVVSLGIMVFFEYAKREMFKIFTERGLALKFNFSNFEMVIVTFLSLILLVGSILLSVNGTKEFTNTKRLIKQDSKVLIDKYKTQLDSSYITKINVIESETKVLNETKSGLLVKLQVVQGEEKINQFEYKKLQNLLKDNENKISENDKKLKDIELYKTNKLKEYKTEIDTDNNDKSSDSDKNRNLFIIMSFILEAVIFGGIFFNYFHSYKSYRDNFNKMEKQFRLNKDYSLMLDIVFKNGDANVDDNCMSQKMLEEIVKSKKTNIQPTLVKDFLNQLIAQRIIELAPNGKRRIIKVSYEEAKKLIIG